MYRQTVFYNGMKIESPGSLEIPRIWTASRILRFNIALATLASTGCLVFIFIGIFIARICRGVLASLPLVLSCSRMFRHGSLDQRAR